MKRHAGLWLALIIMAAVAAGVFVYPKNFGAQERPWQLGCDLVGGANLVYQIDLSKVPAADQGSVVDGLQGVIKKRVDLYGASGSQVYTGKSGDDTQLYVNLCGIKNLSAAIQQIGTTPFLQFAEVDQSPSSTQPYIPTNLTGQYITGAQLTFDPTTGAPQVAVDFNSEGAQIFQKMTAANIGKPLAIFLDGQLIEAPTVKEEIPDGKAVISGGNMTVDAARQLVERFNAGALPAPITLVDQRTISATLGGNTLKQIIIAGIVGTILVLLFMLLYYGILGIFSSAALIIYIALTLGIFKIIPITMDLAGIAGFVLTIGMAVDANILIFERIKEERKKGLPYSSAIEEGFRRAWPSIRDSNTSTIITAIILYYFTSDFVRGFALTLLIGVLVSLFSAITTTRLFLFVFLKEKKPAVKSPAVNN